MVGQRKLNRDGWPEMVGQTDGWTEMVGQTGG